MLGRFLTTGLAAVLAVTALSGCGGGGEGGEGGTTSPSPAMTRTQAPLDRAKDALLTAQEIPVPPPSDTRSPEPPRSSSKASAARPMVRPPSWM